MLPRICMACGGPIKQRMANNPNVCAACCCAEEKPVAAEQPQMVEPRVRVPDEVHPPRRRSPAIGDHSHERKTSPALPRRKH